MTRAVVIALLLTITLCATSIYATTSVGSFHLDATTYDSNVAMNGWYLSKSTFCNRSEIAEWTCPVCALIPGMVDVVVAHNETTGGQGFVGYLPSSNVVVVAFRGSDDTQNWIFDFDTFFTDYPNADCTVFNGGAQCKVHQGFHDVYGTVKDVVLAQTATLMVKYGSSSPGILVTGHSLGAAVAILAAADITLAYKNVTSKIAVYTYGEPRVGNPAWAKWMAEAVLVGGKQYRVTHEADPVPRVPPLEFGFLHVPHEVWYNNDLAGDNFTVCVDNATAEDYTNCENTQFAFVPKDHLLYLGVHAGCRT
jgi:hypothetical protein